jgi:hypothetical protein
MRILRPSADHEAGPLRHLRSGKTCPGVPLGVNIPRISGSPWRFRHAVRDRARAGCASGARRWVVRSSRCSPPCIPSRIAYPSPHRYFTVVAPAAQRRRCYPRGASAAKGDAAVLDAPLGGVTFRFQPEPHRDLRRSRAATRPGQLQACSLTTPRGSAGPVALTGPAPGACSD